jgi:hypothetical protein
MLKRIIPGMLLALVAAVLLAVTNLSALTAVTNDVQHVYLPIVEKPFPTPTPSPTPTSSPTPIILIPTRTPSPTVTPAATLPPGTNNLVCTESGGYELCAWVSNGTPPRFTTVTVYGRLLLNGSPVSGQQMFTTWHYLTTTPTCNDGVTGSNGIASCSRSIGGATAGHQVNINVQIGGQQVTTWFTPQ